MALSSQIVPKKRLTNIFGFVSLSNGSLVFAESVK